MHSQTRNIILSWYQWKMWWKKPTDGYRNKFCCKWIFFCLKDHLVCRLSCPWHVHVLRLLTTMCALALLLSSLQNLLEHSGAAGKFIFMLAYCEKSRCTWFWLKIWIVILSLKIYCRNIVFIFRFTSKEFSACSILISSCLVPNCWNNCVCRSCLKYGGCVHFWERKVMYIVKIYAPCS